MAYTWTNGEVITADKLNNTNGNFIVNIVYDEQQDRYRLDQLYATIKTAFLAGKNIIFVKDDSIEAGELGPGSPRMEQIDIYSLKHLYHQQSYIDGEYTIPDYFTVVIFGISEINNNELEIKQMLFNGEGDSFLYQGTSQQGPV